MKYYDFKILLVHRHMKMCKMRPYYMYKYEKNMTNWAWDYNWNYTENQQYNIGTLPIYDKTISKRTEKKHDLEKILKFTYK